MTDFIHFLTIHYTKFYLIDDNLAMVLLNDKWGLIDNNLNVIIPIKYTTLSNPSPNIFFAFNDFYYGAFNEKGEIVLPFKYKTYHMIFNTYYKQILKKKG